MRSSAARALVPTRHEQSLDLGGPLGWVDLLIVSQVEADEDGEGVDLGEADEKPRVVVVVLGERLAEKGGEGSEDGNGVAG